MNEDIVKEHWKQLSGKIKDKRPWSVEELRARALTTPCACRATGMGLELL